VLVEGHHVGVLSGFRFTPTPRRKGADAQALRNAAQRSLAGAMVSRAERLARAGDGEIVLSRDGFLRWLGDPSPRSDRVDDVLKPRLRDSRRMDQLTGGPRRDDGGGAPDSGHWAYRHLLKPLNRGFPRSVVIGNGAGIALRLPRLK
jgi:ATP-dependent RNA helicase SUPV3L1/SUV3